MSYEFTGGSLKLKGVSDKKIKKKKKSKSSVKEMFAPQKKPDAQESVSSGNEAKSDGNRDKANVKKDDDASKKTVKTKAELAFEKAIERRMEENILKRAAKSHKEHVELYNNHLESLSEFHDIPKVSWTK
jgi:protein FAM32A